MSEETDISKLHGTIKEYALACERDKINSKGYGKLNTSYELNLFKEMVIKYGKQKDAKDQIPNIKGITLPKKDVSINDLKKQEKDINNSIINYMKDNQNITAPEKLRDAVKDKSDLKKQIKH